LDVVLAEDMFQGCEISSLILAADGLQALSGDPERIGNRQPDGLGAYVQSQNPADNRAGTPGRRVNRRGHSPIIGGSAS